MGEAPITRWAWAEIDLGAVRHNMKVARDFVGEKTHILAVVKADGYGHGAIQVARTALDSGADHLAVATVDEGIKLREGGITAPILMLAEPPISAIPFILENNLTPTVTTIDFALALGEQADLAHRQAGFHLGVNTGMNRIGIHYTEAIEFLKTIDFHRGLRLEGVFTHFATADASDDWDFKIQLSHFTECIEAMRMAGIDPGLVHCANSASIIRYPQTYFDMVRWGICLYGLHPSSVTYGKADLRPAMSIHARVTHVKEPPLGEGVSYGLLYRSPGSVQIATLPLGYADGLRRNLSDNMSVLYKGYLMPQVGRICMDQCMFEVSPGPSRVHPVPRVEVGDEVVIIGEQGDNLMTLDMMADALGTINYELACGFGMRLPRVYV